MKYPRLIFIFTIFFSINISSKEITSYLCHKRGYEIIFPYEEAIYKIKKSFYSLPKKKKNNLKNSEDSLKKIFMEFLYIKQQVVLMPDYPNILTVLFQQMEKIVESTTLK